MTIEFVIGETIPGTTKVQEIELPEAVWFENDELTGRSNFRSISYSAFDGFLDASGLRHLFEDELKPTHPGYAEIRLGHLQEVRNACQRFATAGVKPEFGRQVVSAHYARCLWFEWWMEWALKNCKRPGIENY